ncbi:MAG: glycosyltransferase [Flavobacteriales bacterium]
MVSIVVATYNRCDFLEDCIKSYEEQNCDKSLFEVLIIDNNSTDDTEMVSKEVIEKYPELDIRYMIETNQGLSYGRNRGIKESKYDLIHFFDDDAVATSNYISTIIDTFERYPKAKAAGGKILLNYFEGRPSWASVYMESIFGLFDIGDTEMEFPRKNYPRGSNMTFKRELFDEVGGFDVSLGRKGKIMLGGEEKEMFQRVYEFGASVIYNPLIVCYHAVPESRTRIDFMRNQVVGIGVSENIRINNSALKYKIKRHLMEGVKWCATFLLFAKYLFVEFNWAKASLIVRFRWWITKGILQGPTKA